MATTFAQQLLTYGPWVVTAAAAAAAAFPRPKKKGVALFWRQVIDLAALNFGNAKTPPSLPDSVSITSVKAAAGSIAARWPQIQKVIDEQFANKKDDLVLVDDLAKDLAPEIHEAATVEHGAELALFLAKIGII